MPTLSTPTAVVAYSETGQGAPLLLLHATLHDRSDFDDVVPVLAASHRVIAIDFPCHGESPSPTDGRAPGSVVFADVLEEFVDALDLTDVVLIGNSVGGYAACRLAVNRPDLVRGIVTVQGAGFTPTNTLVRWYCRALGHAAVVRTVFPTLITAYMRARSPHDGAIVARVTERAVSKAGSETAAALWRSFAEPGNDLRPVADRIGVPTLIIWGTKDLAIPRIWARRAERAIPGARFVAFDTGHIPFSSDPTGFLTVVKPFLESVRAVTPGSPRRGE